LSLAGRRLGRPENRVCLRDRRREADRREQLASPAEGLVRAFSPEGAQAASLAEQGVRALGNVPELAPAPGRLGVADDSVGVIASGLGELGAAGAECMLEERRAWLDTVSQSGGEFGLLERERGSNQLRQDRGVVGR